MRKHSDFIVFHKTVEGLFLSVCGTLSKKDNPSSPGLGAHRIVLMFQRSDRKG